jgi:hypothetical protein
MRKRLSANDIGLTGSHQAGILVPKDPVFRSLLPVLDEQMKNPRQKLRAIDRAGRVWGLEYIYYNSKRFGGTRDEYRITCLTRYLRAVGAAPRDFLVITPRPDDSLTYDVELLPWGERAQPAAASAGPSEVLKLSGTWTVVKY